MSTVNSFDKNQNLAELNQPLFTGSGVQTAAARKAAAAANMGVVPSLSLGTGLSDVRFLEQPVVGQGSSQNFDSTGTMTSANLLAFIITSTTAAAVSATLPTGSSMDTGLLAAYPPALVNNDAFDFSVINTGPNAFTIITNTGWTLVGSMVVATGTSGRFRARRSANNTYVLYRLA